MKRFNERDFKRLLAYAGGCALTLATALIGSERLSHRLCSRVEHDGTTYLIRDTVPVDYSGQYVAHVLGGVYNPFKNAALVHFYRDTTGDPVSCKLVENLNSVNQFTDYHELRHARNHVYILAMRATRRPNVFAADEMSARIAEFLADMGGKPPLPSGYVSLDVNYDIADDVTMRELCDYVLTYVLYELYPNDAYYTDFPRLAERSRDYNAHGMLGTRTVLNKIMTFRINGRSVNMLRTASPNVRKSALEYINCHNPAR